ncbi:hypothetical protein B0H11DRAFT_2309443 [Mycena galericulata]|nr:hypothetical protein B0H11DRAFT_2309443 [Mycena galericulata]
MSSPQSTAPFVLPDSAQRVSPLLFGSLFNSLSFGMLVIQIYVYRACFPRDRLIMKSLVYFVFLVIIVCICLNISDMYYWFGSGFGDSARLVNFRYSSIYAPILSPLVSTLVQVFFCYRIFIIKRSAWPITVLISMISVAQFAGGLGGGILALIDKYHLRSGIIIILTYVWLVSAAAADIIIAVMMTYLLLRTAVHPSTRDVVKDVVTLIIETNTFSALVAILTLGLLVGSGSTIDFICPSVVLPGMYAPFSFFLSHTHELDVASYANTLLATLNNRAITSNKCRTNGDRNSTLAPAESALQSGFPAEQITGPPLTRSVPAASIPAMSFAPTPEEYLRREKGSRSITPHEEFWKSRISVQRNNSRDSGEVARVEGDECT